MPSRTVHRALALGLCLGLGCRRVFPDPALGSGVEDFYPLLLLCAAVAGVGFWARRHL